MGRKKKKVYTAEETKAYELRYKRQDFKQVGGERYEWVDLTFYMLNHTNFKQLSGNAVKLYLYLVQWAYRSENWFKTETFEYSQSMAERNGVMSIAEAKRSLNELWDKGFIDKVGYNYRRTATWKFSNRWYTCEPKYFI